MTHLARDPAGALAHHDDTRDLDDADHGFLGALEPARITDADGRVVWDADAHAFLAGERPDTAHPALWRAGRHLARHGLYQVTDGVYQVRGLDLSTMTLIEGDRGVVVADPLLSAETAAAALALYRAHRGDRPVTGVVYTHSHPDHFGGARGVLPPGHEPVPVLAPDGFLDHALGENLQAGPARARHARHRYGTALPKGPAGQIGCGLGPAVSTGTLTLVPPTARITRTGQEETVDGLRLVFHLAPGATAPAELSLYLPHRHALLLSGHDALTTHGGAARARARHLAETLARHGHTTEVLLTSHHRPVRGTRHVTAHLTVERDLHAYLHDQTLRLLNRGHTPAEIAEELRLPPALETARPEALRRYLQPPFDDDPARLWQHPPAGLARRYTACLGGVDATVAKAKEYTEAGDLRFAATLLDHAVLTDPGHAEAREALATVYERLGHAAADATWRNHYLTAAADLRDTHPGPATGDSHDLLAALTVDQLVDSLAVRVDGPRAWPATLTMDWHLTDEQRVWRLTLSNGALTHRGSPATRHTAPDPADLTLTLTRAQLPALLTGSPPDGTVTDGDPHTLGRLLALLDPPDPTAPAVTP
ncbi:MULTISPECIES: alkyl/aryl-sulfatase [Streptomycetaceae]|uniref:Metallo-beta-lactamase domain-containing protein n=1 Tax=Streptantibioticus cattleyicolor (strain ATCC 35852 / DSM 46488 / JCM 4925 / NBRC 14057 / NRRL 8057) TaxID=1003195 RepID=F8JZT6_STREN|nr:MULTISPECIES: alkyl sulfatase dimerization domain-containing protein [Streptomycetaceae]AEW93519.1 hypothetical protein SCATT_11480 [Streptantibioticus cattleyicolor NRRL 8057 = DSM 46488]MYS58228.1 MBL fold metallo-hydrolase [Streptomyces sp. SID5468]CCB73870.1 conserved protein of unknown function [Streptantibioticus cattleyicolor NRRL 8057 = DSM 46488]